MKLTYQSSNNVFRCLMCREEIFFDPAYEWDLQREPCPTCGKSGQFYARDALDAKEQRDAIGFSRISNSPLGYRRSGRRRR